jgi:hypothetical protein
MPGDTIKAGKEPVTVAFPGGSTITLAAGSSAIVVMTGQTPVFRLETGAARYSLSSTSAVKLMALDHPVQPSNEIGVFSIGDHVAAGKWPASLPWLLGGGAAAAAILGFGVASVVNGGPPVSPIK